MAREFVEEPIAAFEASELVGDNAREGWTDERVVVDRPLADAGDEQVNVVDVGVDLLELWQHLQNIVQQIENKTTFEPFAFENRRDIKVNKFMDNLWLES